eukprot:snap_masked-scaffold_55-processed-gene-1.38-mRNA-1 protein AED:1.00 eAED:1.00 QI:0/-1/0/0/-1/1/1/0/315
MKKLLCRKTGENEENMIVQHAGTAYLAQIDGELVWCSETLKYKQLLRGDSSNSETVKIGIHSQATISSDKATTDMRNYILLSKHLDEEPAGSHSQKVNVIPSETDFKYDSLKIHVDLNNGNSVQEIQEFSYGMEEVYLPSVKPNIFQDRDLQTEDMRNYIQEYLIFVITGILILAIFCFAYCLGKQGSRSKIQIQDKESPPISSERNGTVNSIDEVSSRNPMKSSNESTLPGVSGHKKSFLGKLFLGPRRMNELNLTVYDSHVQSQTPVNLLPFHRQKEEKVTTIIEAYETYGRGDSAKVAKLKKQLNDQSVPEF